MLVAFGWAVIQSSRAEYLDVDPSSEAADDLDETLNAADQILYKELTDWLSANPGTIKYEFTEQLNNHTGILQFHASSNHRGSIIWPLADFIRLQSKGSYGLLHIHDDEDHNGRTPSDFRNFFRVWRILDGTLTEYSDPFFSPFSSPNAFGGNML